MVQLRIQMSENKQAKISMTEFWNLSHPAAWHALWSMQLVVTCQDMFEKLEMSLISTSGHLLVLLSCENKISRGNRVGSAPLDRFCSVTLHSRTVSSARMAWSTQMIWLSMNWDVFLCLNEVREPKLFIGNLLNQMLILFESRFGTGANFSK